MTPTCDRDMGGVLCGAPARFICRAVDRVRHVCLDHLGLVLRAEAIGNTPQWDVLCLEAPILQPPPRVQLYVDAALTKARTLDPANFHTGLKIVGDCPHHGSYIEVERQNGVRYMARTGDLIPIK